ncbi:Reverse transcriptase (RNA-dependent DNA polymerase) [Popillia japonica]|uniref:Reverse transcriptase (RNA-dependent DNA polymerase) n=1 Tax=Popillia japonica TaxID=7064 RepID=A0AAW1L5Y5_POPJA
MKSHRELHKYTNYDENNWNKITTKTNRNMDRRAKNFIFKSIRFSQRYVYERRHVLTHLISTLRYNYMELDILLLKLVRMEVTDTPANNMIDLFRNRQVYVRTYNGELFGPKYCSIGLPQGSTLSSILFNLYTADFHKINNADTEIIQYADDICIVEAEKSIGVL